ncbi:MAG: hypothetical protein ACREME_00460, partial [Gemmatimonadales bacterium]
NRTDHSGTYGPGNRIETFAGCGYDTDSTGNVTQRSCPGDTTWFMWSAENGLTRYIAGSDTIDLHYDASGRLVRRDVNGSAVRHFLWDGAHLLAELNGAATGKIAEYSYLGMDRLHALIVGNTVYYPHTDAMGNVIALTDSTSGSSAVKRTYDYDVWGGLKGGSDPLGLDATDGRSAPRC